MYKRQPIRIHPTHGLSPIHPNPPHGAGTHGFLRSLPMTGDPLNGWWRLCSREGYIREHFLSYSRTIWNFSVLIKTFRRTNRIMADLDSLCLGCTQVRRNPRKRLPSSKYKAYTYELFHRKPRKLQNQLHWFLDDSHNHCYGGGGSPAGGRSSFNLP
jgi:hypothetical protein